MAKRLLVSVVDDDESVRESLPDLLKELGYSVQAFSSAEDFLASDYIEFDEVPHPRPIDAGHVWARSSARIGASSATNSNCLYHRSRR